MSGCFFLKHGVDEQFLQFCGLGFTLTGLISLCVGLFCLCILCFCQLHMCCITVNTVGWTWWDWSLILKTLSSFSTLTLLVGSFLQYDL